MRRARRLRLGLYEYSGDAIAGEDSGGAGAYGVQRQIQDHASFVRAAFAHRSWNYRIDGSGARAVRASIVVLAETRKHSRESQTVRADSQRIPDESTFAEYEQRAVPVAEENHGRAGDDDDRFCAAEHPHGDRSKREDVVFQPSDGDAGAAGPVPDRFRGGMEFVLSSGLDFPDLRQYFSAAGSGNDDPAGRRIEAQPAVDAD